MEINIVDPKPALVDDYDFCFQGGHIIQVTVDLEGGDTFEATDSVIFVNIIEKPSPQNPNLKVYPEDWKLYKHQLLAVKHTQREVLKATDEQKVELAKLYPKTIH